MRIADTSFLYALFSSTDSFHAKAIEAAKVAEQILVPAEIFSETIALIHHRQGHEVATKAGDWMFAQGNVEIAGSPSPVSERGWDVFVSGRGRLSYPDSIVISWCEARGAAPLAFDAAILRRARK